MPAFTQVVPVATQADLDALTAAAAADAHQLFSPTHAFKRGEEIVGGVSLGSICLSLLWFDSKRLRNRDSFALINTLETALRLRGVKDLIVPCSADSPFADAMPALGFRPIANVILHAKTL